MAPKIIKIKDIHAMITRDEDHWLIYLMNFVDNFRFCRNPAAIAESYEVTNNKFDALLASTIEELCEELEIDPPEWVSQVPSLPEPWFVSPLRRGKIYSLVESPVNFRKRNIFVFKNFLHRV